MNIRHGDMALMEIGELPDGLKQSKETVLMVGSGGNHHTYQNGKFYPKQVGQFVFGYFESLPDCRLFHKGHGQKIEGKDLMECWVPANKIFELRKQQEETHAGMRPVVD